MPSLVSITIDNDGIQDGEGSEAAATSIPSSQMLNDNAAVDEDVDNFRLGSYMLGSYVL